MVVSADINELVEFTCRDYDKLFFTKNISLHESYTEKCMAEVNERFFTQAVSNYITNAIKHCKEEGNVYVRVMSGENNIKVEVENDGNIYLKKTLKIFGTCFIRATTVQP